MAFSRLQIKLSILWPWFLFLLGVSLFYLCKFYSPVYTQNLFQKQEFAFLNRIAQSEGTQSLDFYQGRVEEVIFGPLAQLLGGLLFAAFCFKISPSFGRKRFAWLIFIYLLITKFEVLFFPPYGDAVGGPFAEALWLKNNSFNFAGLLQQPNFMAGGPRVYGVCVYPAYLALCLKLIPWTTVFLVSQHVLVFALTAIMTMWLRDCFLKIFDDRIATLASLIFIFVPLIQSQSEAINMEIPSAFFMLWAVRSLLDHKNGLACFLAVFSALVKGTGVFVCLAVGLMIFVNAIRSKGGVRIRYLIWSLLSCAGGLAIAGSKFFIKGDTHVSQGLVAWGAGWPSLEKEFIFYLYLFCLAVFFVLFLLKKLKERARVETVSAGSFYVSAVIFLNAGMWFALFYNFLAVSPRYRVALYPFLIFIAVFIGLKILRWRPLQLLALWCTAAASLFYSYGAFYGSVPDNDHVLLERSLEYRNDLTMTRKLVRVIENNYSDQLIGAPFIIAQTLAIPELGYVKKKLDVMIYGFNIKYGGIHNYPGLKHLDPFHTVFIGVKVAPIERDFAFPVGPKDFILEKVESGNKSASIFRGGYSIELLWRATNPLWNLK